MSSPLSLLAFAALATTVQSDLLLAKPSPPEASLSFVSKDQTLLGVVYGIDAVDAQPRVYGQRLSASVSAGKRTAWYSCPNEPQMSGSSRITFDFVAGQHYELICQTGKAAVIRSQDDC